MKHLKEILIYSLFLIQFCLVIQASGTYSKDSVPVLIWSNERQPLDMPAVSAIPIPFSHVEGKYMKSFNQDNILLFQQDTLSVEDLSSHEDVFNHVSKYMENGHSLYLPAVETGTSLPHTFSAHGYNIITLEPGSAIGELKLKKGIRNLVVVKLPSTTTNPSRQRALQKTDEIIGNVISKIGKVSKFTVIFTGLEPSFKLESKMEHSRVKRATNGDNSTDDDIFITNCVIMYLRKGFEIQKGNSSFKMPNNKKTADESDCQSTYNTITVSYKDVEEHQKIKIQVHFSKFRRYWAVDSASVQQLVNNNLETVFLVPEYPMEHVPMNKSYACNKKLVFISNTSTEGISDYKLLIHGVQVQAFMNFPKVFDDSWDCVGFFTIPIWMGLFTGMLLTFILLIGMAMLVDIKTMDRFDDPKGKHIVLTGTNE